MNSGPAAGPPTYFRPGGIPSAYEMGAGNPSFAVPTEGTDGPGWHDSPVSAYSQRLDAVPGATPDPMRELYFPTRDYRPDPRQAPAHFWTGPQGPGRDYMARHQQEFLDADGITADKPRDKNQAPRPARPDEPRPSNRLSPHNYIFTRPYGQETERFFDGNHFSMADHRRTYAIMGMAPPMYRRNTYRTDPVPWDTDRVDMPTPSGSATPGHIIAYDLPPTSSYSTWRL
jgi:hypothetical protein